MSKADAKIILMLFVAFFAVGYLNHILLSKDRIPLRHRSEQETKPFRQGETKLDCPGQHTMTVEVNDQIFFLECYK
jgi:hypothetical protein